MVEFAWGVAVAVVVVAGLVAWTTAPLRQSPWDKPLRRPERPLEPGPGRRALGELGPWGEP
jgi:hypothetical protein